MPDIRDAVSASDLIFGGTVLAMRASSVANLPAQDNFAVVRVERVLRSDSALGDLSSKEVTVALLDGAKLKPQDTVIFLTSAWIFGCGIAAREVARTVPEQEAEIRTQVGLLPERHLAERLVSALLVVTADVTKIRKIPFDITWRNAPQWAAASLKVEAVLSGKARPNATALFPTANRPAWAHAPRLQRGQRAIFLLHPVPNWAARPGSPNIPKKGAFTALDPADVQPETQRALVERLLKQSGRP